MFRHAMAAAAVLLAGCASTGVVPLDPGLYFLHKKSAQPAFGSADGAKADVYREATAYCRAMGRDVETVRLDMVEPLFLRPGSASLTFRCRRPDGA